MLDGFLATTVERYVTQVRPEGVASRGFNLLINNLKLAASTLTLEIATEALEVCGMAGYAEGGSFSISRIIRDLYSARLMISNSRLVETNSMALLLERYG
jgi:acyl-CoA dehydrogenase